MTTENAPGGHRLWRHGRLRAILALAFAPALAWMAVFCAKVQAENRYPVADSGYLLRGLSTADGLPENSATAISQTRDGYLWVGTWNGLARYNGDRFVTFNPANTPQLPEAGIVNLYADKRDRLWVSTTAGLVVKEGAQWRPFGTNQGWAGNYVRTFAGRTNGDLLITTFDGHVLAFENDRLTELPPPPGEPGQGYLGAADENGQWWLAQNRFVGYWTGQRWVEVQKPGPSVGRSAVSCAAARDGCVWVLLGRELLKFRGSNQVFRTSLPRLKGGIWTMAEDSYTNLWICSYDSGLYQRATDGALRHWTNANELGTLATRMVFEDQEENLWIATNGDGLKQLIRQRFYRPGGALPRSQARSVAPAHDGSVWIALYDGGLRHQEAKSSTRISVPGPANASVYGLSVLEDRAGRLWYGDEDFCWVRRGQDNFEKVPLEPAENASVRALFEDSQGRVWIGTREGTVVYDGRGFEPRGPEAGLPRGEITCFGEHASGGVWVAGAKGVFRQVKDQFTVVPGADGQPLPGVLCFHADPDGTMWMGTRATGLVRWREGTTDRIGVEHGWPEREVRGILDDGQGYFWMPSDRGIVRASRPQLHAVADGKDIGLEITLLDEADGLPSPECSTTQPNGARDTAGRLWFATQKGVAIIDPAGLRLNTRPPPVQLEQLTYHRLTAKPNAPLHWTSHASAHGAVCLTPPFVQPIRLPPGSSGLEVEFAALSFTAPEKVRFRYELLGRGWEWQDAGTDRVVRFHQLPPGEYVFRVRAANNDGVWNEAGVSLAISVLPFFWQTLWFRFGTGFLLVALGSASVWSWSYRRTVRAVERERSAQALHASQARLEAGSDLAGLGYYEVDYGARICFLDDRFRQICGVPPEVKHGLDPVEYWLERVHPRDRPGLMDQRQRLHEGKTNQISIEYRYSHPVSGLRWLHHNARVAGHGAGQGRIRTFGVIRDITERKRAEAEMQRLRLQLWHADRVAQTGAITASLAHELNQPLTGILSTAQAGLRFSAAGNFDPALIREILTNIVQDTKRAGSIINGLRAMLRRKETQREPIDLADTIQGVLDLVHSELIARQVQYNLRLDPNLRVMADLAQLQQVLLNLVMNALEAMEAQPPEQRRLELSLGRNDAGEGLVAVRDSGPGIPEDQQEKLFLAFWTTKQQGMGIGLPISYAIIESHGGRLWCANNPDGGATFYFTLPVMRGNQ